MREFTLTDPSGNHLRSDAAPSQDPGWQGTITADPGARHPRLGGSFPPEITDSYRNVVLRDTEGNEFLPRRRR